MRFLKLIAILTLCIVWILLLNNPVGSLPPVGKLLHPIMGFWHQAERTSIQAALPELPREQLKGKASLQLDERLVPHITATNDEDLYFIQGYLHAYYRLWQMDMQSRAAGGYLSEVAGKKALAFDRNQRRKGMVWAAENSLAVMEKDPRTKLALDAYTHGVNTYIGSLDLNDIPLEYKLMNFRPEPWTNLKCALLLKYMADDLTGNVDDIALSYLREQLSSVAMTRLFPEAIEGSQPVIAATTKFAQPALSIPEVPKGELWASFNTAKKVGNNVLTTPVAESGKGSNNWAIGPARTADSSSLLCNDPHLGLNLPSIWYELQLQAPGINCYGVSIPGAPGIVIGFNDSISWGFTNNYRDVKDYYEIFTEKPGTYRFEGKDTAFAYRYEVINIKGASPYIDSVRYTIHGPVIYEEAFPEPTGSSKNLAVTWMAHRGTNELLALYLMNRARNYETYLDGMRHFECPAQNFVYTDRKGNIAMSGQGRFINKWKGQGRFVMRGDIAATLWGDTIPMHENPTVLNPPDKYVVSANQQVTTSAYPYWYNGDFTEFRSWAIHHFLEADTLPQTTEKMMALQNNNYSMLATKICPLLDSIRVLSASGKSYQGMLAGWNYYYDAKKSEPVIFQIFWNTLKQDMWQSSLGSIPGGLMPADEISMQLLIAAEHNDFLQLTGQVRDSLLSRSLKRAIDSFEILNNDPAQVAYEWYDYKNTSIVHLAKIPAFSYEHLANGGWGNTINAMKGNHGPSWRMIVQMNRNEVSAYVIYPGGQSGNPGSRFYHNFIDHWVAGKYYKVNFYTEPGKPL